MLNLCHCGHDILHEKYCLLWHFWPDYFISCQCFTLMVPLINKSNHAFQEGNRGTKSSYNIQSGEEEEKKETLSHLLHNEIWSSCRSTPSQALKLSEEWKENCQSAEGKNQPVTVLHAAALSLILELVSSPAPRSLSCLQHPSSQRQHPASLANSVLSESSIKTPPWLRPLPLPLAAHKPQATPRDQTARLGPWLRLSIGSYRNGRLSPYCLIG